MVLSAPVWDDGTWSPLPALEGAVDADLCVVGLGGSGLAALREARLLGASVVGVDAGPVGGGAAGRNGGFLLAGSASWYHRDRDPDLYRLTLAEMDRIEQDTPAAVRRVGSVRLACSPEEEADCDAHLAALRADGLPAEPYDGAEGRGLLFPRDGALQPLARCRALARAALDDGGRLFERSPAVALAGDRVTTTTGEVRTGAVVVAVDGGLERLVPELAGRVRTVRGQMLATAPTDEVRIPWPVYARWGWDYWQQLADGRVVLGGCRDRGGQAEDTVEGTGEAVPSPPVQALLDELLRERLRVRRAPVTHRWAGLMAFTPDRRPIAEEVRPHVFVVGGYCGHGNVVGSLLGRQAARAALTGEVP